MPKPLKIATSAPYVVRQLTQDMGKRLRLARQRRRMKLRDLAARAGMSYDTARAVERGELATAIGAYVAFAWAMGIEPEFGVLFHPEKDVEGMALERARTPSRVDSPKVMDDDF